jgi:hypothetical protein
LNGEYVVVEQVQHEILEKPVWVYNFEVASDHTYFVGENAVGVHNDCPKINKSQFSKTELDDLYSKGLLSADEFSKLTIDEVNTIIELRSKGNVVECIERIADDGTADFLVNGIRTELKTLKGTSTATAVTRIQEAFSDQYAEVALIDTRMSPHKYIESDLTTIVERVKGTFPDKQLPGKVIFILDNGRIVSYE